MADALFVNFYWSQSKVVKTILTKDNGCSDFHDSLGVGVFSEFIRELYGKPKRTDAIAVGEPQFYTNMRRKTGFGSVDKKAR